MWTHKVRYLSSLDREQCFGKLHFYCHTFNISKTAHVHKNLTINITIFIDCTSISLLACLCSLFRFQKHEINAMQNSNLSRCVSWTHDILNDESIVLHILYVPT